MSKFYKILTNILKVIMIVLLGIITIVSVCFIYKLSGDQFSNKFFGLEILTIILGVIVIFSKMRHHYKISILLLIGALLRVFWIFSVNTMPVSDFGSMYEEAQKLLTGDTSVLKGYTYLARFPHLIPMTFYMAGIIKVFSVNSLVVMKLLNAVFGVISVYLLYKLADNFIESERNKLFILLVGSVFLPFITYTSVLCTENIAIPLYLATLIMFYNAKRSNENQAKNFIIVGILLAFSNLFRGVGIVFLIAFLIYILLCTEKKKFTNMGCIILGYIIITLSVSGILLKADLIERPLWHGAEPSTVTLLLKGTNFEHNGMWNLDDAEFIDKYLKDDNLTKICLEKIKERILSKSPKELFIFYIKKFASQWEVGDCAGTYWAYLGADMVTPSTLPITFQYIYIIILVFAFLSYFKKDDVNNTLLNIALFGFYLLFTIIETQPRYSYIVSWIFILFACQGIEMMINLIRKGKAYVYKASNSFKK